MSEQTPRPAPRQRPRSRRTGLARPRVRDHSQTDLFNGFAGRAPGRGGEAAPFEQWSREQGLPDPARRQPGAVRVGTSGYSFPDWVGPFYPPGTKRHEMLDYYQRFFNTVEINATYYRIPPPATMQRMVERTPPHFDFMVKLPGALTHKREKQREPVESFRRCVEPMQEAEKLAGALAQFPYSFHRSPRSEAYLAWLRETLPEMPLFVEFRHRSWDRSDLSALLEALHLGFCSVDEPALPGLIPRRALTVGDVAYARFHGRNTATWWGGGSERYDYRYDESELAEWAAVLEGMAERATRSYIFFNNCHAGHAVLNAKMMEDLLGLETIAES
ncbi:MAG: DUF72 domain-containing protein [Candidatus Eisenbacteria bacterium]|nr:DUF72 domain-containing protein [Candidatus Eisenbacteria bacterium]